MCQVHCNLEEFGIRASFPAISTSKLFEDQRISKNDLHRMREGLQVRLPLLTIETVESANFLSLAQSLTIHDDSCSCGESCKCGKGELLGVLTGRRLFNARR